jgi:hypothetical protein
MGQHPVCRNADSEAGLIEPREIEVVATGEHIHRVRNEIVEIEGFGEFVGRRLGFRFI